MRSAGDMTAAKSQGEATGVTSHVDTVAADGKSGARSPRISRWLDENLGGAGFVRRSMRHIFPDHWSFFLGAVSYTHLRAHETDSYLVCRLLLEKKKNNNKTQITKKK